jgi:hypothetical protein
MEREKEREGEIREREWVREQGLKRSIDTKLEEWERERERERKGGREIELDSNLEKIVEQNVTYTYLS